MKPYTYPCQPGRRESATAFFTLVSARYERGQHHPDLEEGLRGMG